MNLYSQILHIFFLLLQLCPDWQIDYETYDWKKLDPDSEETKKMFSDYFSWTGTDKAGRPFNQGKIFKQWFYIIAVKVVNLG